MTCKEATYREVIKIHDITGTVARELNETIRKKTKTEEKTEIKNWKQTNTNTTNKHNKMKEHKKYTKNKT